MVTFTKYADGVERTVVHVDVILTRERYSRVEKEAAKRSSPESEFTAEELIGIHADYGIEDLFEELDNNDRLEEADRRECSQHSGKLAPK